MAFHHRKLLNESLSPPEICQYICDAKQNPEGLCSPTCFSFCPASCKSSIIPPPPPPSPPPPPPPPLSSLGKPQQLSVILTASLAVLATAFFLFTCYTVYKFYTVWSRSRRRRLSQRHRAEEDGGPDDDFFDEEHGPVVDHPIWYIRTIGLQPSVINAITTVNYKKADGLVEGTDCAVCLSEFEEDETLRLLPKCNHAFHIPCIDTWLGSHTNCPMCRAGIVSNAAGPSPVQEATGHDSGRVEETRSEVSRTDRVGIEDDRAGRSQNGSEVNENGEGGDCKVDSGGLDGLQPVRRSVSMDSLSASIISAAVANAFPQQSEAQLVKTKDARIVGVNQSLLRLVGSPSIERSMQTGSSSIKRSASCSAKLFLSRHSSRSRN